MSAVDTALDVVLKSLGRVGTISFALVGVLWVVYSFLWSNTRHASDAYYDKRLELCLDVAKTAAQLATSTNPEVLNAAVARFEELYWGQLVVTENDELEAAMVALRQRFVAQTAPLSMDRLKLPQPHEARIAAIRVSKACHDLVQPTVVAQIASWFRSPQKAN